MPRFRKRPVEVEAVRWDGKNGAKVCQWLAGQGATYRTVTHSTDATQDYLMISTLEGEMYASDGDWIIRGVQGEFYPCKPDIFEATYEEVS